MYSRKKYIIAIVVVLITLILGSLVVYKIFQDRLNDKDAKITELQNRVDEIGEFTGAYRLMTNVKAGNECNDYDLEFIEVPVNDFSENMIVDEKMITGRYYKLDMAPGTILTTDMFVDYELTDDMRYMDVVFDEIPIGLEAGDYIDVRISFPLGQDYIAITHKRVAEINGSTVKLIVSQKDFYYYESMKTDIATFESTKIYGAQYVEAGIQEAAVTYYPVRLEVMLTLLKDPNIDTADFSNVMTIRQQLEEQLYNSASVDIADKVTQGRKSISERFESAREEYTKIQQQKEKQAAQDAKN